MASMNSFHRDEIIYPNPDTFDPWRFLNLRANSELSEVVKNQYTSITPQYRYFGNGKRAWCVYSSSVTATSLLGVKHACSPGRFFADMELKAILCYIMMNYNLKAEGGVRLLNDELGIGVLPSRSAEIMIRRKFRFEEVTR